jgi:hypothetical protein
MQSSYKRDITTYERFGNRGHDGDITTQELMSSTIINSLVEWFIHADCVVYKYHIH